MNVTGLLSLAASFDEVDLDSVVDLSSVSTANLVYLNWALRTIGKRIKQFDPKIVLTLTASVDTYSLRDLAIVSKKVVRAYRVLINGNALQDASRRDAGMWAMEELERLVPSWRTQDANVPSKAIQYGQKLVLNPKPTQAVVDAGSNYIAGTYLAPDLTTAGSGTDVPDLPEELHEALAYLTRIRASYAAVSEQEAWTRLNAMQGEWMGAVEEVQDENERMLTAWGTTAGYHYPDSTWL